MRTKSELKRSLDALQITLDEVLLWLENAKRVSTAIPIIRFENLLPPFKFIPSFEFMMPPYIQISMS